MNEAKRYDYVDDIDYGTDVAISDFPQTLEEVERELRQAELEMDDPSKWCSSEEVRAEVKQLFPCAS